MVFSFQKQELAFAHTWDQKMKTKLKRTSKQRRWSYLVACEEIACAATMVLPLRAGSSPLLLQTMVSLATDSWCAGKSLSPVAAHLLTRLITPTNSYLMMF
jgi:hypothetical protein